MRLGANSPRPLRPLCVLCGGSFSSTTSGTTDTPAPPALNGATPAETPTTPAPQGWLAQAPTAEYSALSRTATPWPFRRRTSRVPAPDSANATQQTLCQPPTPQCQASETLPIAGSSQRSSTPPVAAGKRPGIRQIGAVRLNGTASDAPSLEIIPRNRSAGN